MIASRRRFMGLAATASLGVLGTRVLADGAAPACYDPAGLPLSQKSRRRSLEYVDASADPARHCGVCSFFTAAAPGCGTCTILGGGPVSAAGVCSSFAARGGK